MFGDTLRRNGRQWYEKTGDTWRKINSPIGKGIQVVKAIEAEYRRGQYNADRMFALKNWLNKSGMHDRIRKMVFLAGQLEPIATDANLEV
jgi:hypothetical protein